MVTIREATESDRDAVWSMFHAVVSTGDSFVFDPNMSRGDALDYWFQLGARAFVAVKNEQVIGTYMLRPNNPGLGSHVANAGFMVATAARGLGVGRALGQHCLREARRQGFRAMQFNFVVSTNCAAVRLWEHLGFQVVGTLPGAFRHSALGFVDALVMFRSLEDIERCD